MFSMMNCKNCGAVLRDAVCEYCGTVYEKNQNPRTHDLISVYRGKVISAPEDIKAACLVDCWVSAE